MTAQAETDEPAVAEGGKKKPIKLIIMAVAALVVLLGAGAASYFLFLSGDDDAHAAAPSNFIFSLPPMTVNLNTEGPGQAFMRLTVALEVRDESVMTRIEPRLARVTDAFQTYLRELRRSDLEGSAGIYRLREELLRRVNVAIYPEVVDNILFSEILIQ